jgi:hypothetical protein
MSLLSRLAGRLLTSPRTLSGFNGHDGSKLAAKRPERVERCLAYSGDRDAARVDVGCASSAELLGREGKGERRDAGNREEQNGASAYRGIPEPDLDASARVSDGHAGNAFGGSANRPYEAVGEPAGTSDQRVGPLFDLRVLNSVLLKALNGDQLVEKGARVLQNCSEHICLPHDVRKVCCSVVLHP